MPSPQQILAGASKHQIKLAGCGLFAQVLFVVDTEIAIKKYDETGDASVIEGQIYERLGIHPFILQCYGEGESIVGKGLVLQYLQAGTLADNLELDKFHIERKLWPIQAVEAVKYIHSKGVIHCDISIHNFLVQNNGSIALADFCGSVLENSKPFVAPATRYTRPVSPKKRPWVPTTKDDIFALGTVLYEISVGHRLYAEKSDREVRLLFQKREFPDTAGLAENLRTVVEKCWQDRYDSAEEVKFDLARG
ncbi:kinase-like domain-containing protein [Leptodontidium sp. MPI-SDFR-AT-0119]|nr:kinase-like domain-containing protein [Leptodontidium sp. MPI-SDFR-AT-0119]